MIHGKFVRQGLLLWLVMAFTSFLLGLLDDLVLAPLIVGVAVPLTGLAMAACIAVLVYSSLPRMERVAAGEYWLLGLLLMCLTLIFECFDGFILEKSSLEQVLAAYNPLTENLWIVVMATVLCSPRIVSVIRGLATLPVQ